MGASRSSLILPLMGAALGSTLALALLVGGCVFAAVAGPALSLHTRSQALHQALAALPSTARALQVSTNSSEFQWSMGADGFAATAGEMGRGFAALGIPLAAGQWDGVASEPYAVSGAGPRALAGRPPKLEVLWRDTLPGNARLTAGSYAAATVPPGMVGVAATTATAARFGLHPGSRLSLTFPDGSVGLFVTAILAERAPDSTFWLQDPAAAAPALQQSTAGSPPYWLGGVLADPDQLDPMQFAFSLPGLELEWEYPLDVTGVDAGAAPGLADSLTQAVTATPALTGAFAPNAVDLTVAAPLTSDLSLFFGTEAQIQTVLLLLFVSLTVTGATVILLAAGMTVTRRSSELTLLRSRGGSVRQVAAVMARTAAIAVVPPALIGAGLAIAVVPGHAAPEAGWELAGLAVAAAAAGPPLVAAWHYRRHAAASNPARITGTETRRPPTAWRRPVAEVTACAVVAGALIVMHDQGGPAAGSIDPYLIATPVLVAVAVVLIMLRLYPLILRGLLWLSGRQAGVGGFVAMARAARSPLAAALPAFALVLALSLASFAGMVTGGIARGETAASWRTTGADVLIDTGPASPAVTPGALRAIAAVRGVRHAAAVWTTTRVTPQGQPVTVAAVDPASYAGLTADTPFPAFPAVAIRAAPGGALSPGTAVPVLASPAAAAALGSGTTLLSSLGPTGPLPVHVVGVLPATPAQPGGGSFVIMPLETVPGPGGQPAPNMVLVTGSAIDDARLSAVAGQVIPGNLTTFRASVLAALSGSPLQHGAGVIIALTLVTSAALGLSIVILGLALGAAERELTLARLAVMGHQRSAWLVVPEAMPAVLAAVVAGAACALLLPPLVGSSIDLSAFTGTTVPVRLQPGLTAFGWPAAGILAIALAVLAAQARALRRHPITGLLRAS
jgi:putative ABC transport system permease protein